MSNETIQILALIYGVYSIFISAAYIIAVNRFTKETAAANGVFNEVVRETFDLMNSRQETRMAFKDVSYTLKEGLESQSRRLRIARIVKDAKTPREKQIAKKAQYEGQMKVMLLVAQDWDRKFNAGIVASLTTEATEMLPKDLEVGGES